MNAKDMLRFVSERLIALPRVAKISIAIFADACALCVASVLVGWVLSSKNFTLAWPHTPLIAAFVTLTILFLWLFGCYATVVRFISVHSMVRVSQGTVLAWLTIGAMGTALGVWPGAWRSVIIGPLTSLSLLTGWRLAAAQFLQPQNAKTGSVGQVLIYGAGEAGRQLAAALKSNRHYRPVGFVDDCRDFQGRQVQGLPVYMPDALPDLKKAGTFERILLAVPTASRKRRREILENLEQLAISVLVMPPLEELVRGDKQIDELQEVQIEDLLGRDAVAPVEALMACYLRQCNVLVTGAGGSIGSELCRQAIKHGAKKLVLFDLSEFALYTIDRELRALVRVDNRECEIVPVLGSVVDRGQMLRILLNHQIETVYHAAAYKHVPLVEQNIVVAVQNNALGTLNVVHAVVDANVRNFVLISSDKAVRPTSVMGASKRVCELIVQALAIEHPQVRMSMVRFGNVLASSGSVVPLFKEQIAKGGPVTVTHPDVTRYFMTIPEAAQLAMQAGAMGGAGEVFVLDMGEPVRIADLAERMIHLSGLDLRSEGNPNGDIAIKYTGLRPGEKLFEELMIGGNREPTQHPRIFLDNEKILRWSALNLSIKRLERAIETGSVNEVLAVLRNLVDGFGEDSIFVSAISDAKDLLLGGVVTAKEAQGQILAASSMHI